MNFNIFYTKLGNQFFFISNLTEWHFSCRPNYNPIWLKKIKELSQEEKKALNEFSKILKKYSFKHYLGVPFYTRTDKNVWSAVKKMITESEYETLRKIFSVFDEKFNKIWNPKILDNNAKILKRELQKGYCVKIEKDLLNFIGKYNKNQCKKINIFLLKHPVQNSYIAGGANLGNKGITLECNKLVSPKHISLKLAVAIAYHEFIHFAYQKKLEKKISKIISQEGDPRIPLVQNRSLKEAIVEIIIDSLFPEGYLAEKHLHYQPLRKMRSKISEYEDIFNRFKRGEKVDFNKLQYYIVYKLFPLTKEYIETKKRLDEKYIKTVLSYLKN